jgi:hypothetical protein
MLLMAMLTAMLNWLFGKTNDDADGPKDYSPLAPRLASTLRDVLESEGSAELLTPHFAVILKRDYSVGWRGGTDPYELGRNDLAFAYLAECRNHKQLRQSFELSRQVGGADGRMVIKQALDTMARQLGPILKERANAPDLNL